LTHKISHIRINFDLWLSRYMISCRLVISWPFNEGAIMQRSLHSYLLASVSSLVIASVANAADLPMAPPFKALPPEIASWAGFYIGADGGVARLNATQTHFGRDGACGIDENGNCSFSATGGLLGAHAGYNFQSRYWVYGVEGDWTWTGLSQTEVFGAPGNGGVNRAQVDWLASARARAGIALEDTFLYITGGLAFGGTNSGWGGGYVSPGGTCCITGTGTRLGWVAGGGVEHMFTPHWSIRGEALYYDLNSQTTTIAATTPPISTQFTHEVFVARAGVSYKW
jgi:outer membrane immunogenic protein